MLHEKLTCLSTGDTTALQILEKGFDDLMELCDVVATKFAVAREDFEVNGPEVREIDSDEEVYTGPL